MSFCRLLALLALSLIGTAWADPLRDQQIATVDPVSGLLAVGQNPASRKVYHCTPETVILIDDRPAKLSDLAPGMMAVVTATKPGIAARVAALRPAEAAGKGLRQKAVERQVTVAATNTPQQALMVAQVFAGQVVRIVARQPVSWTSGGKKGGRFCDWNGYPEERVHGLPRMALVAFVDRSPYLPSGDGFTFVVPKDGVLGLFANDDDAAGNLGTAEVTVSVGWY